MIVNNQTSEKLMNRITKELCSSKIQFVKISQSFGSTNSYTFNFKIQNISDDFNVEIREINYYDGEQILFMLKGHLREYILNYYFGTFEE